MRLASRRYKYLAFVLALIFPVGALSSSSVLSFNEYVALCMSKKATQADLLRMLNNKNPEEVEFAIRFTINRSELVNADEVLEAIWNRNSRKYPNIDITYLDQPIIRIAVAAALATLHPNKRNNYYEYVLSQLETKTPAVLPHAILGLGYVGSIQDMARLEKLAKDSDGRFLFQAAASMLTIDKEVGSNVLEKMRNDYGAGSSQGKMITQMLSQYKPSKSMDRTPCETHDPVR